MIVSSSSVLLSGLPYAVFTQFMDYVPSIVLEQTEPPPQLRLTKYYFKPQLAQLQSQYNETRALGNPVLEEWFKGLESSGARANQAAARFDRWEYQGGLAKTSEQAGTVSAYAYGLGHRPPTLPMSMSAGFPVRSSDHIANASGKQLICFFAKRSFHNSLSVVLEQTNTSLGRNSVFILCANTHRLTSGVTQPCTSPARCHQGPIQAGYDSPSFHTLTSTSKKRADGGGCGAYEGSTTQRN